MLNIEYLKEEGKYQLIDTNITDLTIRTGFKTNILETTENKRELMELKNKLLKDFQFRTEYYTNNMFQEGSAEQKIQIQLNNLIGLEDEEIDKFSLEEIEKRHPELFKMTEEAMLRELKLAASVYYNTGAEIMSDERYDSIEIVFRSKFPENTELDKKVGAELNEEDSKIKGFNKVGHTRIVGVTQHKAQNIKELSEKLTNKNIQNKNFIITEKLDGISLYAIYDKTGKLVRVVSRGTGTIGDDITANAIKIQGLKQQLNMDLYDFDPEIEFIEIRGEGIITNEDFAALNKDLKSKGKKEAPNPRNAASGIVRRLDGINTEFISFMPYEEIIEKSNGVVYQRDETLKMKMLDAQGFRTPFWAEVNSIENMETIYKDYIEKDRPRLRSVKDGYEIDGLVFKVDSNETQEELGMTNKKQNGQIALKFPPETGITKLIKIHYSMGNTGVITPVAVVEPKFIGGVTITNISLANEDIMNGLLLAEGDTIEISRRNDVIPKIEKNLKFDKYYLEFHAYMHEIVIKEIEKRILSYIEDISNFHDGVDPTVDIKVKDALIDFKENLEFDLGSNVLSYELEINEIIAKGLYKNGEFLGDKSKTDKQILDNIAKFYQSKLKKEIKKSFESFEKGLTKTVESDQLINGPSCLFDEIKEVSKDYFNHIDKKQRELVELNQNNEMFVSNCPICGSTLISEDSSKLCNSDDCAGVIQGRVVNFIVKNEETMRKATIVDETKDKQSQSGIGKGKIKQLYEAGLINKIKDLYTVKPEDFVIGQNEKGKDIYIEGFGQSSVTNLLNDIDKLRKLKDIHFLAGLNIKHLSESRFLKILQKFNYKDLINGQVSRDDLLKMPNFGDIIIDSMMNELESRREEILELLEYITIEETEKPSISMDEVKNFVITGSVEFKEDNEDSVKLKAILDEEGIDYSRNGFKKFLTTKLGHNVPGSVTSKTDYLINDDILSTSGKNKKAKDLNIPIIKPEELFNILYAPKIEKDKNKEISIDSPTL